MDQTIDRLTAPWTSRWISSVDKSVDRSIDKSIDLAGIGEDAADDADAGADHQAGAGDDRRGRAQPRQRIFTSSR